MNVKIAHAIGQINVVNQSCASELMGGRFIINVTCLCVLHKTATFSIVTPKCIITMNVWIFVTISTILTAQFIQMAFRYVF